MKAARPVKSPPLTPTRLQRLLTIKTALKVYLRGHINSTALLVLKETEVEINEERRKAKENK